jgi:hypothetical protein
MTIEKLEERICLADENLEALMMVYNGCPSKMIAEAIEKTKKELRELRFEYERAKERQRRKRPNSNSKTIKVSDGTE